MPGYDPRFWELPFDPGDLDALPEGLVDASVQPRDPAKERVRNAVLVELGEIVRTRLTEKQRRIVELYFYEERTQQEIAAELGISQQVVSRQLFGVIRDGRRVGGAIARLRKVCDALGIDPEKWV